MFALKKLQQKIYSMQQVMENIERTYCPPEVEVREVQTEGLICSSPGPYNSPFSGTGEDW